MSWISAIFSFVAAAGGFAVVAVAISAYAGRLFADRFVERVKAELSANLETHRARLRKSEIVFDRELEAATSFVAFRSRVMPPYRHPLMDWNDACNEIAVEFGIHEKYLGDFIEDYGVVVADPIRALISEASAIAGEFKFQAIDDVEPDVSQQANEAADRFYKKVTEAERMLLDGIRKQIAA